eukprot:CAMPEP_0203706606 /NCGR_PEP_ID=MMETSP0091-20130426/53619_1 /ASSEMBLY_ACC=CAM_ASM_001089 /TAXON_ID=426623 /ORGANISM="Chaetoceros affinis, Strain CCMP159" /LENGTH=62 /DNA_ID=CAMNT_0050582505 /DNA_START=15 /DNA_END=199 /DNA_ORIENTATION=+
MGIMGMISFTVFNTTDLFFSQSDVHEIGHTYCATPGLAMYTMNKYYTTIDLNSLFNKFGDLG